MKKTLLGHFIVASFLVFFIRDDMSQAGRIECRDGLQKLMNDPTKISAATLPRWRVAANTNITGSLLVVDIRNPERLGIKPENLTRAKFEAAIEARLSPEDQTKIKVRKSDNWRASATGAGLEKVPDPNPVPPPVP